MEMNFIDWFDSKPDNFCRYRIEVADDCFFAIPERLHRSYAAARKRVKYYSALRAIIFYKFTNNIPGFA